MTPFLGGSQQFGILSVNVFQRPLLALMGMERISLRRMLEPPYGLDVEQEQHILAFPGTGFIIQLHDTCRGQPDRTGYQLIDGAAESRLGLLQLRKIQQLTQGSPGRYQIAQLVVEIAFLVPFSKDLVALDDRRPHAR